MRKLTYLFAGLLALAAILAPSTVSAQLLGAGPQNNLRDVSLIKPPAGSKVAIVVFEDLGCPACAHAHPLEVQAAKRANVPLLRYDFPIAEHVWTFAGAVCARYIQEKISPLLADQYRSDVFAAQRGIGSTSDLQAFTRAWLLRHGQNMPFMLDPDGALAKAVQADYDLGRRINIEYTPTVIVVTKDQYQVVCGTKEVNDPSRILPVVQAALTSTHSFPAKTTRSTSSR